MKGGHPPMRRQRAQSLVEFAISGLVLVLLLAGAADLGRAFYYSVALQGAAREGARQAGYSPAYGTKAPNIDPNLVAPFVNKVLAGAGLQGNLQSGCPSATTGNAPFDSSAYPSIGHVNIYVCYQQPGSAGYTAYSSGTDYTNGEVDVVVLMSYGLITGWFQGIAPGGIHVAGNVHMPVQG